MEPNTETINQEQINKLSEFISIMAESENNKDELKQIFSDAAGMAGLDENKTNAFIEIALDAVMDERDRRTRLIYEYWRKDQIKKQWAERKARRMQQ